MHANMGDATAAAVEPLDLCYSGHEGDYSYVQVGPLEPAEESSTNELATAWAYCLAKELGCADRAERLRRILLPKVSGGFEVDPYTTGLFLLGERLATGAFHGLVNGVTGTPAMKEEARE